MKTVFCLALLLISLVTLSTCVPEAPPATPALSSLTKAPQPVATVGSEWDRLLSEARREGAISMYTIAGTEIRGGITQVLKDKFGLTLEFVTGRGSELAENLLTERRAGLYLADVTIGGHHPHYAAKA